MSEQKSPISFTLNGQTVQAQPDETIWQVAQREGTEIPHLCYAPRPDYRPDGNCRACMVEIEGERVLAASCLRKPTEGMVVHSHNERAKTAQKMVMELLITDQPPKEKAHDPNSHMWQWADKIQVTQSRFDARDKSVNADADAEAQRLEIGLDVSHPAMHVALDACIQCNLCVRACREVQVNDVIGMAMRGHESKIVFDMDDPMGASTCVACGECVQACPTGALMEKSLVDTQGIGQTDGLTEVDSVCPYCGVGCQLTYQIKDNQIKAVQGKNGPANHERLCVKGRFGFDYVTHPHRLTKPLIRRDDAPKTTEIDLDPANPLTHFREATWEEALDKAGLGLKQIRDEHGGNALAGFGSAKCSNEEAYLFQKLVRTGFGTNNVDHCTRLCHASSVAALLEGVGSGAVSAPFNAVEDSDCIIIIGANPIFNHPVAATFFKQATKRGAKLIIMNPQALELKRHADYMLQFKSGTDVAMLNAMLNVIVEENLYDEDYISQHTEGFENLKKHIADFSPEEMAPICGIDANTLREVARLYATSDSSIIFWGMGVSQHTHGTDNARCLISMALTTGQIGRPGTGLHPLRGQNNVQGASDAGLIPMMLPDYKLVDIDDLRNRFEDAWGTKLDPNRGLTVVEIMHAIHDDEIKGMYIMGENPAMSDPDVDHARAALAKLEHLVVQDLFLTETAFYADVILPASAWPEKDGTVTNTNRQVQRGRAALATPGEVRQDWWITQEIARRVDLNWNYAHPSEVFAEMTSVMPSLNNISWQRVSDEDSVTYPCDAPDKPGNEIVFTKGFPTANNKAKMVTTKIIQPDEVPDQDYPMVLSTGRQLEHWHTGSMTRRANVLDELEPEAVALLAPEAIKKMQLTPGQKIVIATRRGSIEVTCRQDTTVPENMVYVPFCYAEGAANVLTNSALDPFGKIPEFKYCAARVTPA